MFTRYNVFHNITSYVTIIHTHNYTHTHTHIPISHGLWGLWNFTGLGGHRFVHRYFNLSINIYCSNYYGNLWT